MCTTCGATPCASDVGTVGASPMLTLLGIVLALAVLALLGWYLLIETEGVYLGRRVVVWLYDVFASRYDRIKQYEPLYETLLLANPLMGAMRPHHNPLLLDIATGTARLPLALLADERFAGHIIGVDLSRQMLSQAAYKLADDLARVDLLYAPADCLPFPDDTFDAVTFLEALEFVDAPEDALAEAVRVLRPGGLLLTSLRGNIKTMPGKLWTEERMQSTLEQLGVQRVFFEPWQDEYTKVWGRKAGKSPHIAARPLEDVLRCSRCGNVAFAYDVPNFVCDVCGQRIPVGDDGVVEVTKVQRC